MSERDIHTTPGTPDGHGRGMSPRSIRVGTHSHRPHGYDPSCDICRSIARSGEADVAALLRVADSIAKSIKSAENGPRSERSLNWELAAALWVSDIRKACCK